MSKLLAVAAVVVASVTAFAAGKAAERHVLQSDVQYAQPFGPQGPNFGFVEGKMGDNHPATFFAKVPPGFDSGWHIHDNEYKAVVVKGNFSEQQQGDAAETPLPVGSFFTQPGKVNHRNGCAKDGGECLIFIHFDKGANSKPMTADGKPVKMPAADK